MFTSIQKRHKKNLHTEISFLNERIAIDGLTRNHKIKLATYYVEALKFDEGISKFRDCLANSNEEKNLKRMANLSELFKETHKKCHGFLKSPTQKKLLEIADIFEILIGQNLYPRLEKDIEEKIYEELAQNQNLINPDKLIKLTYGFYLADHYLKEIISYVSNENNFILDSSEKETRFYEIICYLSNRGALLKLLENNLVPKLTLEIFLTNLRKTFILNFNKLKFKPEHIKILKALARQCHLNEYIFFISEEEKTKLISLQEKFNNRKIFENEELISWFYLLFAFNEFEFLNSQSAFMENTYTNNILDSYQKTRQKEKFLQKQIPSHLKNFSDVTSRVKKQYEENPYPRWEAIKIPQKKQKLGDWLSSYSAKFVYNKIQNVKNPRILVAGTGTGRQSISAAILFSGCKVDAFDLSKASLAYAKRKALELKVANINFLQADLFDLSFIEEDYDFIQCSGVLHHTGDPLRGLKTLASKLKSTGVLQVGLYSEVARKDLNVVRDYVQKHANNFKNSEIRDIRRKLLFKKEINNEFRSLFKWSDFYSTSMFRDLILHEHELQYNCELLEKLITEADLKFVSMKVNENKRAYFKNFIGKDAGDGTLQDWCNFERKHPDFFDEMYNFFLQKT